MDMYFPRLNKHFNCYSTMYSNLEDYHSEIKTYIDIKTRYLFPIFTSSAINYSIHTINNGYKLF